MKTPPTKPSTPPDTRRAVVVTGDRILVAMPEDAERRTRAGILVPATARSVDRRGLWGTTLGVGPNVRNVNVNDDVLYLPEDAIEVDVHGDVYLIVRERDVHAVATDRPEGGMGLYL
ncbi:MAG: chaperonin GroES [Myxococcota bacterium]|jgi:chaperonin GroES